MAATDQSNDEKYRKAMDAMNLQLTRMKSELDARAREADELKTKREEYEEVNKKYEEENKKLKRFYDQQIAHRRDKFAHLYQDEIASFLTEVGKTDPTVASHVTNLDSKLRDVVKDGVVDPMGEDQLVVLQACASIQKHTSSNLEKLLKSEKEWAQKYEQILNRLNEAEAKNKEAEAKNKEIARERDEIKTKFQSSVLNTVPTDPVPQTQTIAAVATSEPERDFTSLFSRQPTSEWRSLFPEPPPYRK